MRSQKIIISDDDEINYKDADPLRGVVIKVMHITGLVRTLPDGDLDVMWSNGLNPEGPFTSLKILMLTIASRYGTAIFYQL